MTASFLLSSKFYFHCDLRTQFVMIELKYPNMLVIVSVLTWICSVDGMFKMSGIKKSEIKPGVLVIFQSNRVQSCVDMEQRAEELSMELARIMDPPFNSNGTRVNIEKVFDPSVKVGVKPKHMELANSKFDDESEFIPSPNQILKLEIFKIPTNQSSDETMKRQLALSINKQYYDAVFLMYTPETLKQFQILLKHSLTPTNWMFVDPEWGETPYSQRHLIRFLDKILNPSHLDNNTLDDFRDLVARYVFAHYVKYNAKSPGHFEQYIGVVSRTPKLLLLQNSMKRHAEHHPKSWNILRIFHRNLQRHKPSVCPKLEVMRDDFVDETMVWDMILFIQNSHWQHEAEVTSSNLPNLYKLMDFDLNATKEIWDMVRSCWREGQQWGWPIAEFVCRKIGLKATLVDAAALSEVELVRMVKDIRMKMVRVWNTMQKASVFDRYWDKLYEMRQNCFCGRVAIVNREDILTDGWMQSLRGIFGRNNTIIESVRML